VKSLLKPRVFRLPRKNYKEAIALEDLFITQLFYGGDTEQCSLYLGYLQPKEKIEAHELDFISLFLTWAQGSLERLKKQRQYDLFETAIDHAFNAVVITTGDAKDPRIAYANKAFLEQTGYSYEELHNQNPNILQGPHTERNVVGRLKNNIVKGKPYSGETINYKKDGTKYTVEWNISPVFNEHGEVRNFVSVQRDKTYQRAVENHLVESL